MAVIAKFKALRPVRDKVHLVATRPYYSYKKNVLKAKMETNPWTLLNIINPEFDHSKKTKPNSTERFELVKKGYDQFVQDGILIQDAEPKLYLYKQTSEKHSCIGVIAGASVEEYLAKKIKIHEATLTSRESVFEHYLDVVGYNAEPVLLSYSGNKNIQGLIEEIALSRPEYEFTTTDKIKHELWIIQNDDADKMQAYFEPIKEVYIADGHHRYGVARQYRQHVATHHPELAAAASTTMVFVNEMSPEQLAIAAIHRHSCSWWVRHCCCEPVRHRLRLTATAEQPCAASGSASSLLQPHSLRTTRAPYAATSASTTTRRSARATGTRSTP